MIKQWKEAQIIKLEAKDREEEKAKQVLKLQAKKELEDWYKQHTEQVRTYSEKYEKLIEFLFSRAYFSHLGIMNSLIESLFIIIIENIEPSLC